MSGEGSILFHQDLRMFKSGESNVLFHPDLRVFGSGESNTSLHTEKKKKKKKWGGGGGGEKIKQPQTPLALFVLTSAWGAVIRETRPDIICCACGYKLTAI